MMSGEKELDHAESVQDLEAAPQVSFLTLLSFNLQTPNGDLGNPGELLWDRSQHS